MTGPGEADKYSSIAFGRFAAMWNQMIVDEEAGDRQKTHMTLKSAYHLQAYWKEFMRASNSATTCLLVDTANKLLRREWRRGEERLQVPDPASVRDHVQAATSQEASPCIDLNDDSLPCFDDDEGSSPPAADCTVELALPVSPTAGPVGVQTKKNRKEREDVAANVGMIVRRMKSMSSHDGWLVGVSGA
jgi:hypothetical protein